MSERKIIVPGEVIVSGDEYLPGEGTEKDGKDVIALRYGIAEESNKLVKVIPLSGTYMARRGNVIIGKVIDITFNGWMIDIGTAEGGFLSLMEVPRYVDKNGLDEVMDIGDMLVAKIVGITKRGIDLTIKMRGLGKIEEGMIMKINPNKVPRVIGKEGSMINIIKEGTGSNITVGQNGLIWIKGDTIESELNSKEAINFVAEKSYVKGLTEELKAWMEKKKK
ncbi:MAG: exosome complex RNA-binding protein Rrp4 [Nanoarchaeota archaeon]